jgi:TQXA domain-containing protein/LPXTG-motif cell wall-anchored protein
MASRFKLARAGAGVTGAAVVLMMAAAIPASAEPVTGVVADGAQGLNVDVGDGFKNDLSTELISLTLDDGTKLGTYCVEIDTALDRAQPLVEREFDDFPDQSSAFTENRDMINWILHNGFPEQDVQALAKILTDRGTALSDGSLNVEEAVAGTQAAIWHFSDRTDLNQAEPVPGDARSSVDVLALYEFLIGPDNVGLRDEPTAALQIDPKTKSGTAGERIGPFEVRTNGTIEKLATSLPYGVRITDAQGRQLRANQIVDTSKVFFDVPEDTADGAAKFILTATAAVDTGRLFVGQDEGQRTQSVIVADSEEAQLTAEAFAEWKAAGAQDAPPLQQGKNNDDDIDDDGGLAQTGASIMVPLIIGAVLMVAGGGTLLFLRRKKA